MEIAAGIRRNHFKCIRVTSPYSGDVVEPVPNGFAVWAALGEVERLNAGVYDVDVDVDDWRSSSRLGRPMIGIVTLHVAVFKG